MKSKPNSMSTPLRRRIGPALLTLLAALALALTVPARAGTQPAAIPLPDIGARATANYHGDALGITATADGARLRCGFQKLEGHATAEGLWLESTKPGGAGRLRLTATALGRAGLSTLNPQRSTVLPATGKVSVEDKLVRFTRPGLTEEYSVSVDGVRQDFIIESPPLNPQRSTLNQSAGDLRVELVLSGARAEVAAGGARLTLDGSGRVLAYSRLRVEDATGRELTARLEVLAAGRLAVSVADTNAAYPVRIDPTFSDCDWVSLGSGMAGSNPYVFALAVSGTNLYAGGGFTSAGGVQATNIARWDGSAWSALGSGLAGSYGNVSALAVSGTNLYAGGAFATASGVPANAIARWDGSAWSALGSGMSNSSVYFPYVGALLVSGTNLYAGGSFAYAGGVPVNNIAKWDGNTWSALGSGFSGDANCQVKALAVSGTDLYAGGTFTTAGGVPANYIARWDGSAWSALGAGMNNAVHALAVSGTNLYAGGDFTTAGGVPANYIAKWDGSAWSSLGSGMCCSYFDSSGNYITPVVEALAVSGTDLCAGGAFTNAGGVAACNIAKWDGSAWSALGSGAKNGYVIALAADGAGHLFVGGSFSQAGTNLSPCIAEAVLPAPSILQQPTNQIVLVGSEVEFTVAAMGIGPLFYQWLFNSTNTASIASTNCCLELTNVQHSQAGTYTVVITNGYGAVTSAPAVLTVSEASPPTIVTNPSSQAVWIGATVDFSVAATGLAPLSYYWFFNATNPQGTGPNLHLADVQLAQAGAYSVTVSNLYGAVTSAPAVLTVTGVPPLIVASPASLAVPLGATADFQVAATGSSPLVYQWIFNGTTAIAGATGSVLSLGNGQLTQAGTYSATVSNLYGAVTSAPALLQVFPPGVVVTNSEADLRAVMALGGTVTFACDGTITLTNTITNALDTVLDGNGHQVTISGGNAVRVFCVNTNINFTVVNLTIANGTSQGGSAILNLGGTVNLTGVAFQANTAFAFQANTTNIGGAIFNRGGTVNAANCSFAGNTAQTPSGMTGLGQAAGGAIRNEAGLVALRSCTFMANRATGGDGYPPVMGSLNGDPGRGAAIHNSGTLTLDLCTLAGNSATGGGGGNWLDYTGGSGGEGSGGAIFNQGTVTIDRTTLSGNTATGGSGGMGSPGDPQVTLNGWPGGTAGGAYGAAICNLGSLWVTRSTLASNVVTGGTGGAGGGGGGGAGMVSDGGSGAGGAGGNGGSGFGGVDGTCNLINCTVAGNCGYAGSGGAGGAGSFGNPTPGAPGTSGSAWGGTACGPMPNTLIASNTPAGGDTFTDPKLGPLANNGGPTFTMALLPGSPAIDAGNTSLAPPTDQRGFPRPAGLAADIGAFEYGSVMPTVAISLSGADVLNILASGNAGQPCRLLSSTDLLNWVPIATDQFGTNGTILFYDTYAPGSAYRFYRLVMP